MKAWMRVLTITLTSKKFKKQLIFGGNTINNKPDLSINVSINKYMSTLKDEATIRIDNISYNEIIKIIDGEYFDVDVLCGYKSTSVNKVFSGGVIYISNALNSDKTSTLILICGSKLVAQYSQKRLNFSLHSGINTYSALKFVCDRAGIKNSNISTQFKKQFIENVVTCNMSAASFIDSLCKTNLSYITNADNIKDSTITIFDANKSNSKVYNLTENNILLTGGYPKLTSDGLNLSMLPTLNFSCGDVIKIDNSIIDISVSGKSDIYRNYGYYLDEDGYYMIYEMSYNLSNRSTNFSLNLKTKSRRLISNLNII